MKPWPGAGKAKMNIALVLHATKDLRLESRPISELMAGQLRLAMEVGGICGSDLHYYNDGGYGTVRVRQPLILGHEISGRVVALADDVAGFALGDLVAVSPSRPCMTCPWCQKGHQNHCTNMRFYASAMPFPHIQGAFVQDLVADARQCYVLASGITSGEGAMAEPLSVCLHGLRQVGDLFGLRILITGCGPIGLLSLLAARVAGAGFVAMTDVIDSPLVLARSLGADVAVNTAEMDLGACVSDLGAGGDFDVVIEASGAAAALRESLAYLKPRGIVVQIGLGGDAEVPLNMIVAKELRVVGSFRFHEEFSQAVDLINRRRIDVRPLISHSVPLKDAVAGFELAYDRQRAMKVHLDLTSA